MKLRPDCSYSNSKKSLLLKVCEPAPRASAGGAITICRPPLKELQRHVSCVWGRGPGQLTEASSLDAFLFIRLEVGAGDSRLSPLHLPPQCTFSSIPPPHTHTHTHTHTPPHTPILYSPNSSSPTDLAKQIQGFCPLIFICWSFNKISK